MNLKKRKIYCTQRTFVKIACYSFFNKINFRFLINFITIIKNQNLDIIYFL